MYDTTACTFVCCISFPQNTIFFPWCRLIGVVQTRVLPTENVLRQAVEFTAPNLAADVTPQTRSILGGHSPRRRNASVFQNFKARGLGAHVVRRVRTTPHPLEEHPPDEPAEFRLPAQ